MSKIFLNLFWQILISPKSRITCSRENGRFGKISSNQEKVHGFDNFGKFLVKFLKGKSVWWNWKLCWIFIKYVKAKSAWQILQFWCIFSSFVTAYISGLISLISQFTYFKHCFLPGFFNCIKVTASTFIVCNVSLVTVN